MHTERPRPTRRSNHSTAAAASPHHSLFIFLSQFCMFSGRTRPSVQKHNKTKQTREGPGGPRPAAAQGGGRTWVQVQRLIVAEVGEATVPLGDIPGAVAEDLALHLRGRQAGLHRLLFAVDQHHRVPAGPVCRRLTGVVGAQLAHTLQTCNTVRLGGFCLQTHSSRHRLIHRSVSHCRGKETPWPVVFNSSVAGCSCYITRFMLLNGWRWRNQINAS